jgi:hypothetical protein
VHATGAQILDRISQRRRPPVLQELADSSYLSVIGGVPVRIIEAQVSVTCTDGSTFEGSYRLVTTLLDARRYPADRLVHLYHERWGATRSRTRLSELPDRRIGLMSTA